MLRWLKLLFDLLFGLVVLAATSSWKTWPFGNSLPF